MTDTTNNPKLAKLASDTEHIVPEETHANPALAWYAPHPNLRQPKLPSDETTKLTPHNPEETLTRTLPAE